MAAMWKVNKQIGKQTNTAQRQLNEQVLAASMLERIRLLCVCSDRVSVGVQDNFEIGNTTQHIPFIHSFSAIFISTFVFISFW